MFDQPRRVTFHLAAEAPSHILPSRVEPTLASQAGLDGFDGNLPHIANDKHLCMIKIKVVKRIISPISPTNKVH